MSYFIIGRRPINDTMEPGSDREASSAAAGTQPDTRMLEAAQRQLDTLRATMDARLADLQVALTDPSRAATLPALVMELSRLATSEAHATTARMCMQLRHDGEAALAEAEVRHASMIEAQRKAAWEQQRALDAARKRIEELEAEHQTATRTAEEHLRTLQGERTARADVDRTIATLERQLQVASEQLADANTAARKRADEFSRVYEEAATLREQVDDLTARLTSTQASLESVGHNQTADHDALTAAQAALSDAHTRIDVERQAAAVAASALTQMQGRVSSLEHALAEAKSHAAADDAGARAQQELLSANERLTHLQHQLDEALRRLEDEQVATQDAVAAHKDATARIAALEASLAELERARDEAAQKQLPDIKARIEQDREFERTTGRLHQVTAELESVRGTASELRAALAAMEASWHGEQQTVATLRRAVAESEQARDSHAEALRERDSERARLAELQQANDALCEELARERTAFAELTAQSVASSQKQDAIGADLDRVTASTAGLESALADERARTAAYRSIEHELREQVTRATSNTDAARQELADTSQKLEAVERARREAQQRVASLEESLAHSVHEHQALTTALEAERAVAAELREAVATAEQRLAEAHSVADALRLELESPLPAASAPADAEEVELSFDDDDDDDTANRPLGASGVRVATRYSFTSRIEVGVNGQSGQLVNLSVAGCGIRTPALLEVGAPVIVQLPGEVGAPCEGVVVWSRRDGSKFTKAGFRSGVKFTKADVMAIEAFMILEADV